MATKRNENGKTDWMLSPAMETAADLIAAGKSVQAAADAVEVTRPTVSQWLHHHLGFKARVNQRRCEMWSEMCARMRSLVEPAIDTLEACLTDPEVKHADRLHAATTVLKAVGLDSLILPDPDECTVEALEIAATKAANRRAHDKEYADLGVVF